MSSPRAMRLGRLDRRMPWYVYHMVLWPGSELTHRRMKSRTRRTTRSPTMASMRGLTRGRSRSPSQCEFPSKSHLHITDIVTGRCSARFSGKGSPPAGSTGDHHQALWPQVRQHGFRNMGGVRSCSGAKDDFYHPRMAPRGRIAVCV